MSQKIITKIITFLGTAPATSTTTYAFKDQKWGRYSPLSQDILKRAIALPKFAYSSSKGRM